MNKIHWTKKLALIELKKLADDTMSLEKVDRFSEKHINWLFNTLTTLEEIFGQDSKYFNAFNLFTWTSSGAVIGGPQRPEESWNPQIGIDRINKEAYTKQLKSARGLLLAAITELERKNIESVYHGKDTVPEASQLIKIINIGENKLRKAIDKLPEKEKSVQDVFENLLIGADIDYSRETESIEYSTKTYKPDFTVNKADLAIEIKICNRTNREKEIIAEINDDILAYKQKYGNLFFIIYDISNIRDVDRFKKAFEKQENVIISVVKH